MRRAGSVLPTHQRTKFESTATLCILFVIGDLFAIAAIVYLLSGDKRVLMIQEYNHYAELWNSTYLDEYRNSSFSIQVNSRTVVPTPNTTASGAYYPYRDACSSKKDPPCLQVPVFFWSAEVDEKQAPEVIIAVSNSTHSIPRIRHWSLTKKEISCEGGSQTTCSNFCQRAGGTWNSTSYHCDVTGYLSRVCLRFAPVANSSLWILDSPPRFPLIASNPDLGCEATVPSNFRYYDTHSSWHPFLYSLAESPLHIELRHYADPYIRASAITGGCSSAATEERACFGVARSRSPWVIGVGCVIVVLLVVAEGGAVAACVCGKWPGGETASTASLASLASVTDLPLEEKPCDSESPLPPKADSNTEEGTSTVGMLEDEESGTMHIAKFETHGRSQPEFEDSFLDSNYEGCEDGI
ncbi:hypothetical protein WA538_002542 [Blastocystis sp. DL]